MQRRFDAVGLVLTAVLVLFGCDAAEQETVPVDEPTAAATSTAVKETGQQKVTFLVKEMSERLNILWDDWPNKVEKALDGLEGVVEVEEIWDENLLHVTYDADTISLEELFAEIKKQEFEVELK